LSQQRESEARPPGGSRTAQFHERAPGKTATKHRIEFRNSARVEFDGGPVLKSFKSPSDDACFEFPSFKEMAAMALWFRFLFAYLIILVGREPIVKGLIEIIGVHPFACQHSNHKWHNSAIASEL